MNREVLGLNSAGVMCCVPEQDRVTPSNAGFKIPMKWWPSLHMTDKLLTRMLNLNVNIINKHIQMFRWR